MEGLRLGVLAIFIVGPAEVVVRHREVRLEGDGLSITGNGLLELALVSERVAEVAVRFGVVGLEGDGRSAGSHGVGELALVLERFAEEGWSVKGFRPRIEDTLPEGYKLTRDGKVRTVGSGQ